MPLAGRGSRSSAAPAVKVEAIVLEPDGDQLKITLKGDLASAARDSKRSPDTGDLMVQIKLVAGARNPLNLEFPLDRQGFRTTHATAFPTELSPTTSVVPSGRTSLTA